MPTRTSTCPSGLVLNVRGLKTTEANILADAANVRKGTTFDQILKAVTLDVVEPGPYAGEFDWRNALVCDRFYALVQARIATYGPDYNFTVQCDKEFCRKAIGWTVNLETDLEYRPLPEASRANFLAGNRFDGKIPSTGRAFVFQLMTGKLEVAAAEQAKKARHRLMTLSLNARIVSIDGVDPNDKPRVIDGMDMADTTAILDMLDAADGGLQSDFEVECGECGSLQTVNLPFDKGFWLPSPQRKKADETTKPGPTTA